ncbi:hypothetical protein LG634_14945 [Streptomyces bambusae]|nr:hypothetical protein [Streptomyces bambusae]
MRLAEEVLGELRTELVEAGIALPSVRLDPVSSAGNDPRPLIDLGRCNPATAAQLAATLRAVRRTAADPRDVCNAATRGIAAVVRE